MNGTGRDVGGGPDAGEAALLIGKLSKIPDAERRFTVRAERAWADYQVGGDLLGALRTGGLPARLGADGWRYDPTDLLNVALHLVSGSRQRKVLAWWTRELGRPYGETVRYRMDYLLGCPEPEHSGACHYSLLEVGGHRAEVERRDRGTAPRHSVEFRLQRRCPALPDPLRELIDEISGIRFLRLPDPLRWDVEFISATGVGDCCGVATLLVTAARARGFTARTCFGRSLTPPFSSAHYWAEVRVDDAWVPLDPVLIDALLAWRLCDPGTWTRYDSLGAILGRLAGTRQPLALHNGRPVEPALPTWRVPASCGSAADVGSR
jgi:hypothetical protein